MFDDFVRREVAFPAVKAARTKFAAIGAADLRGDAERVAVARLAVKRGIGGNQNAFDERAVGQFPEKFLRDVARALFADEFKCLQGIIFRQLRAQFFRQVRHRVPARDALDVKPFEQLGDTINRLLPKFELGFEFLAGQGFDVSRHVKNLDGAGRETKRVVWLN